VLCVILFKNYRINSCQTQQLFGELLCLTGINMIMYMSIISLLSLSVLFFQLTHLLRSVHFQISAVSSCKLHVRSVVTLTLLRVTVLRALGHTQITKSVFLLHTQDTHTDVIYVRTKRKRVRQFRPAFLDCTEAIPQSNQCYSNMW
jgi:hypothetical protein